MKYLSIIVLFISFIGFSQKEKPKNYRRFDEKLIHFGFMLGGNSSDVSLIPATDAYEAHGVVSIVNKSSAGGQVGVVSTLKLGTPVLRLRFIPTLSFQERILQYQFVDDSYTGDELNEERINSTNLDFPLMLQFRTKRLNNFAAYALAGGQYSLDLQSQQDAAQSFTDPFLKLKKHDWHGQVGGGLEFFAEYFKFGIELKFSQSFVNTFIDDSTPISRPIDRLYNRVWWFSLIFEG